MQVEERFDLFANKTKEFCYSMTITNNPVVV